MSTLKPALYLSEPDQMQLPGANFLQDPAYNRVGKNGTGPRKRPASEPEEGDEV